MATHQAPPVPGILQARTLEWVAISFSNALKWKVKVKSLSRVWLLATPWTAAYQAPPSMGFSRQEYWSGVPLPSPEWAYRITNFHLSAILPCDIRLNSWRNSIKSIGKAIHMLAYAITILYSAPPTYYIWELPFSIFGLHVLCECIMTY